MAERADAGDRASGGRSSPHGEGALMRALVLVCISVALLEAQDSADARLKLAANLIEKGNYTSAVTELRRALELQPDRVEAHAMLGRALLAQGYSAEAILHLERAQSLDLLAIALSEEHNAPQAVTK